MKLIGYARVSTEDQNLDLQKQALEAAGCDVIHMDKSTGADMKRRGLSKALVHAEPGDVGVLVTSNRKPPLRSVACTTIVVFPHPIQIEVVAAKRIDVPAYQRSDVTQRLVIDLMPLGA